jgi:hypothetical protein
MKNVTDDFKNVIKAYLDGKAAKDPLFAKKYANGSKSLDECVNFILNTVKDSGCQGFTDDEVFGMALHYYDEDDIDKSKLGHCEVANIVTNHHVELTDEEKREIAEQARKDFYDEQLTKQREALKPKRKAEVKGNVQQMTLF